MEKRHFSQRLFRTLVRVLPFDFRTNYQGEMEGVFQEQQREIEERGGLLDAVKLWKETIIGIFTTAPREHWQILWSDAGYAVRMMRKNLGFTLIAILTLALGIGANTAIFSVVHAVLLRPLPYPDGQQLIFVKQQEPKLGVDDLGFSVQEINDYRSQNRTLSGLVEYHGMAFTLFGHGDPDRVRTGVVSHDYFDLFGIKPLLGRTFLPDDDKLGAPAVLVLSFEYWKSHFGSDPGIVGKTFEMNDRVHTVVGVLRSPVSQRRRCLHAHVGLPLALEQSSSRNARYANDGSVWKNEARGHGRAGERRHVFHRRRPESGLSQVLSRKLRIWLRYIGSSA